MGKSSNVGVELGVLCALHGYTVAEVAEVFKIARPTVYNWFKGHNAPSRHLRDKVQSLVDKLRLKPTPLPAENE